MRKIITGLILSTVMLVLIFFVVVKNIKTNSLQFSNRFVLDHPEINVWIYKLENFSYVISRYPEKYKVFLLTSRDLILLNRPLYVSSDFHILIQNPDNKMVWGTIKKL